METLLFILLIGVAATAAMDAWSLARKTLLGLPAPDFALVGRWLGHMPRGRFRHHRIAEATPIASERALGWAAHYLIGVLFAAVLVGLGGPAWLARPTLGLALAVEGFVYAAATDAMKRMMAEVLNSPAGALRIAGLLALAVGVALVALARHLGAA